MGSMVDIVRMGSMVNMVSMVSMDKMVNMVSTDLKSNRNATIDPKHQHFDHFWTQIRRLDPFEPAYTALMWLSKSQVAWHSGNGAVGNGEIKHRWPRFVEKRKLAENRLQGSGKDSTCFVSNYVT